MNKHKYSSEILVHFRCMECNKWWTIGDYVFVPNATIICPHCGAKGEIENV